MSSQGDFYRMAHLCPCGSGLVSDWCRDERGAEVRACERCKLGLLHRIFEDRLLDIFEDWMSKILFDPPPLGCEWQWEDLLKEKGCEQVVGLEEAKRRRKPGQFLIPCPNGDKISMDPGDRSVHILVPREYGDRVLSAGKMV